MSRRTGECLVATLAAVAVAAPVSGRAAPRFEAAVDRDEIALDEMVELRLTLDSPEPPAALKVPGDDMRDFEVVSRSEARQTAVSLGGSGLATRQTRNYRLVLRPRRTGALRIPSATCMIRGEKLATSEIEVKVLPAGHGSGAGRSQPPSGDDLWAAPSGPRTSWHGSERDLSLRVVLDRNQAWLGEQVTASILLISPVPVLRYDGYKPPLLEGFWAEDLETPSSLSYRIRYEGGVPYRVYLLRKIALFPTRSGRISIDPVEADVAVQIGGADPFSPFSEVHRVHRRSAPAAIEVQSLPAEGVPRGFESVNVGELELAADISDRRTAAGQPVSYRVIARGRGNIRALALPRLPLLAGVKAFDATVNDKPARDGDRFGGSRTLETVLVPERAGTLIVPALEWPFFDPKAGRYRVARVPELRVEVVPAPSGGVVAGSPGSPAAAGALRPLHSRPILERRRAQRSGRALFAIAMAAPVLLFAGLVAADSARGQLRRGEGGRRLRRAARVARKRLETARRIVERASRGEGADAAGFHSEISRALMGYAGDKLGCPVRGLTRPELTRKLAAAGAHPPAIAALAAALDACDTGCYGLGEAPHVQVLAAAERALWMLEEADWKAAP